MCTSCPFEGWHRVQDKAGLAEKSKTQGSFLRFLLVQPLHDLLIAVRANGSRISEAVNQER